MLRREVVIFVFVAVRLFNHQIFTTSRYDHHLFSGDVSPSSAIASMVVSDNAEGEVTPTRNLSVEARLSTNCKRKPIKSASSFCASLQCQPFSLVESP